MSDLEQKQIFQNNLLKYISASGKTQREIAETIGVSPQTFNTWCQGIALPRMGKVQLLADYFHINKSDLIENPNESNFHIPSCTDDAFKIAQEISENPDLKLLFTISRKIPAEHLKYYIDLLIKLGFKA